MVVRKPYAFLIKHFKKIHIALLLFSLYIYYKVLRTNGFVVEFVSLGSYNASIDPISNYISLSLLLIIIIAFLGNLSLILLLRHKSKPWKAYLVPAIEYGVLLFVLIWTRNFFNLYDGTQTGMDIRLVRDIIFISMIGQFPIILIYAMRILGVDLQKFNFKMDEEYLEMAKEDREELEINFNIDYHMFIRLYNKTKRYLKYFYLEHKRICNGIILIIAIIILRRIAVFFFVTNKSYNEGDVYNANGYTIVIKNSYYTDKDKGGNIIEEGRAFVIVDISIRNNWDSRKLNLNNFHIIKGIDNYSQSSTTHTLDFNDLGKTVNSVQEIKRDETIDTILIFKVKKDDRVRVNKYVLYYQEFNNRFDTHLRKIKLNIEDLSKIKKTLNVNTEETMRIKTNDIDEAIAFETPEILRETEYTIQECKTENRCAMNVDKITATDGTKIVKIPFSSKAFDGKEMVDFSTDYGKIIIKDSKEKDMEYAFKSAVNVKYYGKYLFITLRDTDLEVNKEIRLRYIVRNNEYLVTLPIDIEGADGE